MNISFYTAAVGAEQQQNRLDVHANNIANVNNYGFRTRVPAFSVLMTGTIRGIEEDLPRGTGSRLESAQADLRGTGLTDTGRQLDFAIEGNGFFALLDPVTGEYSYTRDGSFMRSEYKVEGADENGETTEDTIWYLSDGLGRFVIGSDGRPVEANDDWQDLDIGVFDFLNYDGMESSGNNVMTPVEKNGQVRAGNGILKRGMLERSNVDLAYELSKVIESQRSFSYMLKMVQTSDEIESTVNGLR